MYIGAKVAIMAINLVRWLNYKDLHLVTDGKHFGIEDMHKNLICPVKYLEIDDFIYGLAVIKYKKHIFSKVQVGVINEKGEETLFSSDCERVEILSYNLLAVQVRVNKDESKWMLTTRAGQRLSSPKYDKAPKWVVKDKLLSAPIDRLLTLIDDKGNQLCKPRYKFLRSVSRRERESGVACEGARDGYWYKINVKGVELKARYHERAWIF